MHSEGALLAYYFPKQLVPRLARVLRELAAQALGEAGRNIDRLVHDASEEIGKGALRLIDYDGMFVTGEQEGRGTEVGHKHFQHPGREPKHFGPWMDRFSFIVLDVSLEALQADASLHSRFREGGQAIIFKANDFVDPVSSEVFRVLSGMPTLRESAKKLAAICGASISDVPTLSDFIAGRNIPVPVVPPVGAPKPVTSPTYIGAFNVIDAKDFTAVMRRVGDKIELVGQIVSVKQSIGKRGRGRGCPYVFINFGIWNKDSVKVTIWSEGLGNMTTRPTEAWVGRWISATGLVEPPYEGKHYGRPYRNIGITVTSDSQIIELSEQEARFRLGRGTSQGRVTSDGRKRSNEDILKGLAGGNGDATNGGRKPSGISTPTTPTHPPQPVTTIARTKNEAILEGLRKAHGTGTGTYASPTPPRPSPAPTPGLLARIPGWRWIAGALLLLFLLARGR
jgi:hypothetical protein